MRHRRLWLVFIVILGFLLRIVALESVPAGFTPDEADQGYAAYSLLLTGKDEWGLSWPLTSFRAFADYRAPLQTYLMIPSVAVFGLNEFAVRLPSAVFGTLAIFAVYLLASELFSQKKVGLLAAFIFAVSPWSIQFSRTALEANFASLLFPLGLFLLLLGLKGNTKALLLSATVLGVNLYSYLAAKLFVPLFIAAFLFIYRRQIIFRRLIPFVVIFAVFAAPLYFDAFFGPGNARGKDLIITNFSQANLTAISNEQYFSLLNRISPQLSRLFSNKITFTLQQFVGNYVSYLSPTFWFTEGGRETTYSVFPGQGLLHFWLLPLVVYGCYCLFQKQEKARLVLLAWLFLAIIPAAITKEGYRPNRVGSLLAFWEIIAAYGLWRLLPIFRRLLTKLGVGLIVALSLIAYLNLYFFIAPAKYPTALSYGYRELISKINLHSTQYRNVIFDRGSQSQIFVAFYTRMDPRTYQRAAAEWWPMIEAKKLLFLDMLDPYHLDRYTFKTFSRQTDLTPGNLVVLRGERMNPELMSYVIDRVDYPDRTPAFYLLAYAQE